MMKSLLLVLLIFQVVLTQRSFYASRPESSSKLLPRFRGRENDMMTTEMPLKIRGESERKKIDKSDDDNDDDDDDDSDDRSMIGVPALPQELQGTLEDHRFVQRVSQWPVERQPFWFKNRDLISFHRNKTPNLEENRNRIPLDRNLGPAPEPRFWSPFHGRQNAANSERKGPHKSMHCKFCKPPGVVTPEKPTRPQLETKTKIHLAHEAADLRLCDIQDEPGVPDADLEACVCVLEGENPCPKCVPDKKRGPVKKKTCRCPKGAKPNPNMDDGATPKKKKPKEVDDEFWWEKYSREHDAIAQETWAAYMAQRRKNKKLVKCQKLEQEKLMAKRNKQSPTWYQKLSCQQMIYVEFLSTAIRLDLDENITDRTFFVLGGIGLYPRPKRKMLKKCLRYCHYNSIQFLNQLHLMTKNEDVFNEKLPSKTITLQTPLFTWNERLIMNAICHLEFPTLLRELMERLPALPRDQILPQIPYPVYTNLPKKKYDNPYEEPIWRERVNWVEKMKIDRLNRCRAHMDTKRVKIPPLALVRRPSLIDARPPFLAQIEANEQASRRIQKQEDKRTVRKHPVSTFNSEVDVTAIAGITASEISTTDKADTDEICVFLREPLKETEYTEEEELGLEKEVRSAQEETEVVTTEIDRLKLFSDFDDVSETEEIPFKTPPKTESGTTIEQLCAPPKPSPGPPAFHYDFGKRELDIINEELCRFYPFVTSSSQTVPNVLNENNDDTITQQLMSAAEKLKQFATEEPEVNEETSDKAKTKKLKKKGKKNKCTKKKINEGKCKNKTGSKKSNANKTTKSTIQETVTSENEQIVGGHEKDSDAKVEAEAEENLSEEMAGMAEEDELLFNFRNAIKKETKSSRNESIISDPDPDPDEERTPREPCLRDAEEIPPKKKRRKTNGKRRKGRKLKKTRAKKTAEEKSNGNQTQEENRGEGMATKANRGTMTECYPGQYDSLYSEEKTPSTEAKKALDKGGVYEGKLAPLLSAIIKDLADEGYVSASYYGVTRHPDIEQLIQHLRGEIVTKKKRDELCLFTKTKWAKMKDPTKFPVPDLDISSSKLKEATWKDKGWIFRRAKAKKDEFYFKIGVARNEYSRELYTTLYQNYFGTGRFLNIYYAYMLPKYEEAILRGVL